MGEKSGESGERGVGSDIVGLGEGRAREEREGDERGEPWLGSVGDNFKFAESVAKNLFENSLPLQVLPTLARHTYLPTTLARTGTNTGTPREPPLCSQ